MGASKCHGLGRSKSPLAGWSANTKRDFRARVRGSSLVFATPNRQGRAAEFKKVRSCATVGLEQSWGAPPNSEICTSAPALGGPPPWGLPNVMVWGARNRHWRAGAQTQNATSALGFGGQNHNLTLQIARSGRQHFKKCAHALALA